MKTLYLLRHAKAEPASSKGEDIDRKLAPRGREACGTIGEYMKRKNYHPGLVLCSAAARTHETFELVMEAAGLSPKHIFEKDLYYCSAEEIITRLHDIEDEVDSVMIVGHNPVMHHLALVMAQPVSSDLHAELELKYPTGSLTVLRFAEGSWADVRPGSGELADFVTPSGS
ncbi:MAG TPA: histidine phosphatase family protein [Rickettsiales bacterium]|nr:histidine phosphatase family protein [Rickettsiales bacterium]